MQIEELSPIIQGAFQAGYMEAIKSYEPALDNVRGTEIRNWLKLIHVSQKKFNAFVRHGLIKPFRLGTKRNSPLYYSKAEIKKALLTVQVSNSAR